MKEPSSGKTVPAVDNAMKLLRHIASSSAPEGVATIARATGTNVSTTFNILKTLARDSYVTFDPETKTYKSGLGLLSLAAPVLGAKSHRSDPSPPGRTRRRPPHSDCPLAGHRDRSHCADRQRPAATRSPCQCLAWVPTAGAYRVGRPLLCRPLQPVASRMRSRIQSAHLAICPGVRTLTGKMCRTPGTQAMLLIRAICFSVCILPARWRLMHRGKARFGLSAIGIAAQTPPETLTNAAIGLRDAARKIEQCLFGTDSHKG